MFKCIKSQSNRHHILDTDDMSVDVVTTKECEKYIDMGLEIAGVYKSDTGIHIRRVIGKLPTQLTRMPPLIKKVAYTLQMRGANLYNCVHLDVGEPSHEFLIEYISKVSDKLYTASECFSVGNYYVSIGERVRDVLSLGNFRHADIHKLMLSGNSDNLLKVYACYSDELVTSFVMVYK